MKGPSIRLDFLRDALSVHPSVRTAEVDSDPNTPPQVLVLFTDGTRAAFREVEFPQVGARVHGART